MAGKYVVFLDSDDAIEPKTYSSAIDALESKEYCDLVQFPLHLYHVLSGTTRRTVVAEDIIGSESMFSAWLFEDKIGWSSCDKVYRRTLFEGIRFFEGIWFEDNLIAIPLLAKARGICFSNEGGYLYYVRSLDKVQWTERHRRDQMTSWCASVEELLKYAPRYNAIRLEFVRRISNSYYVDHIRGRISDNTTRQAQDTLRAVRIADVWRENKLSLKQRIKLSALILYAKHSR